MNKKRQKLFFLLYNEALKSNVKHKYSCALTYKNKIISISHNYYIFNNSSKYTVHAEESAIKITNRNLLTKSVLYLLRVCHQTSEIIECKPCKKCQSIINKYNLSVKVFK
jgi:cytidine deaminase